MNPSCARLLWSAWWVLLLIAWGGWYLAGSGVDLPDVPGARFQCLSYAPFRGNQAPSDATLVIPLEQIQEDLALLAPHTDCVRTYSTRMGVDAVVPWARQHDMKLLLGIWIGREAKDNALEIHSTLTAAALHSQSIRAIIVGNEVLLRKEQDARGLIHIIQEVRRQTPLPLTYADVWEFWLKNPEVAEHVDFLTIHILPYWEDEPVSVAQSLQHVTKILAEVQAAFPGKKILIGETGWPSAGRSRKQAVPSVVNQARFIREFIALTWHKGVPYNLIEAFDQPWKRFQEGTVGGHWGLFTGDRHLKFSLTGPVREHPYWPWLLGVGALLSALLLKKTRRAAMPWWRPPLVATLGHGAVTLVYLHGRQLIAAAGTPLDWFWGLAGGGLMLIALILLGLVLVIPDSRWSRAMPTDMAAVRAWLLRRRPPGKPPTTPDLLWGGVRSVTLVTASILALPLVMDGRYRDFPLAMFLAPALLLWNRTPTGRHPMEAWLAAILVACATLGMAVETPLNLEAMAWSAELLLLAWPLRALLRSEWHHLTGKTDDPALPGVDTSSAASASTPTTTP
ncbi:MAG: hypothetical protein HQL62_07740, partial [Magnetococcales bacterium]|nr:hypothetical protein [Magnetococcales bacterium]